MLFNNPSTFSALILKWVGTLMNEHGRLTFIVTFHISQAFCYRQAGILVREVLKFRKDSGYDDWPCIINGGKFIFPDIINYLYL